MERSVTTKVSCTVRSRGKGGDNIKVLPIAIESLLSPIDRIRVTSLSNA